VRRWAAALGLLAACTSAPAPTPSGSASPGSIPPVSGADWPTYHRTPDRAGALGGGTFAGANEAWRSDQLDAEVYASPVVVGGKAFVATENNTVYAFDVATGRQAWSRHLGPPVDSGTLPCGNIQPVSGVTSTPVADPAAGALYVAAFLAPGRHRLFSLALSDGAVRAEAGIDPPG
jgi:hypothetical protein